jgi:hypothetical protein
VRGESGVVGASESLLLAGAAAVVSVVASVLAPWGCDISGAVADSGAGSAPWLGGSTVRCCSDTPVVAGSEDGAVADSAASPRGGSEELDCGASAVAGGGVSTTAPEAGSLDVAGPLADVSLEAMDTLGAGGVPDSLLLRAPEGPCT